MFFARNPWKNGTCGERLELRRPQSKPRLLRRCLAQLWFHSKLRRLLGDGWLLLLVRKKPLSKLEQRRWLRPLWRLRLLTELRLLPWCLGAVRFHWMLRLLGAERLALLLR